MSDDPTYRVAVSSMALAAKIPQGSPLWQSFNASFRNLELQPFELMSMVYDGHSFTTHHAHNWRTSANYLCGQHIGLDMDTGDARSTLKALIADKFISRYASFCYTSMSHTDDAPRARVVFLLDTPIMQATNYTLAASALLWLFGTADRACRDAVRFWYGSKGCDLEYLDHVLPLSVVKKLIAEYQETGRIEKRRQERRVEGTADQAEVAEALRHIPPLHIDYDEWVQVLMGIHSEYGDGGLPLADSWAQGYPGEVERKFRSFKPNGNGAGAVTIATVFGLAKQYGWKKAA